MRRLNNCLENKRYTNIPIWFMRQAGRYLKEFRDIRKNNPDFINLCLNQKLVNEISLQPIKKFDLDAVILFSDILIIPYGLGQKVIFKKNVGPILGDLNLDLILNVKENDFINRINPVYKSLNLLKNNMDYKNKSLIGFAGAPWTLLLYMIHKQSPKNDFNKNKILNVKKPETVKVDDQFARNLGTKDLNDLKQLTNKQIENQYKMSLEELSKEKILNQLEKMHDVQLPDNLVQQELTIISQNLKKEDKEKNKKESEKIAKKRIKLGLILNELGEKNNLKVDEQELRNEIQKQVQSMPSQQKQVLEYYQKNPSATASLRGSIYEEKIINLIKQKSKQTKKTISIKEADLLIEEQHRTHEHFKGKESKTPKKTVKSLEKKKKIRKK